MIPTTTTATQTAPASERERDTRRGSWSDEAGDEAGGCQPDEHDEQGDTDDSFDEPAGGEHRQPETGTRDRPEELHALRG